MPLTLLLAKIVGSAGLVVAVATVAPRHGPRVGGLVASLPQLAVVSLTFFGMEQGLPFAAESAFWSISGICATIRFCVFNLGAWLTVTHLGLLASVPLGYVADFIYLLSLDALGCAWL